MNSLNFSKVDGGAGSEVLLLSSSKSGFLGLSGDRATGTLSGSTSFTDAVKLLVEPGCRLSTMLLWNGLVSDLDSLSSELLLLILWNG